MYSSQKPFRLRDQFKRFAKGFTAALIVGGSILGASSISPQVSAQQSHANYDHQAERTVRLTGKITEASSIEVIEKLLELSKADPSADIELRINSGGGGVNAALAIYDVMKSLPNDIKTVCEGDAQSMAALLLSAGTQGKRYAYPNCEIMYHQPTWGKSGQITDMDIITSQGKVSKDKMIEIISEDTGYSKEVIRDLLERNFYPSTDEAIEMGFIDHIIEEKNPDLAPAPKNKLPKDFCENDGRKHMAVCKSALSVT